MFKRLLARLQVGQAIVEYMPTIAGAMAMAALVGVYLGGGVTESYCKVVDAFGDRPDVCGEEEEPTDVVEEPVEEPEVPEEPVEPTCAMTLSSADGSNWNTAWTDGETDTLVVNVDGFDQAIAWTMTMSFPNDASKPALELGSGTFDGTGSHQFDVEYPAQGDWGAISSSGDGRYNAKVTFDTVTAGDPCPKTTWTRYYEGTPAADLAITITHDLPSVTKYGEILTYTMTVTNYGPFNVNVKNGQGAVVQLPIPADVTVLSAIPTQGKCDMSQIACDLGAMKYGATAKITVITSVDNPDSCSIKGDASVLAADPVDPDLSNNQDSTVPGCSLACTHQVTSFTLEDTTNPSSPIDLAQLTDGSVLSVSESDRFNVRANVAGDVDYVKWIINGGSHMVMGYLWDYTEPYEIMADHLTYWDLAPGYYTVEAVAYQAVGRADQPNSVKDGRDTYCSIYSIGVIVEDADPNDPLQPPCTCITPGTVPTNPTDGSDPNQPREAQGLCPDDHPIQVARFDHYATADNLANELRWGIPEQQSHSYTFDLDTAQDVVVVLRSAVGHPELNCPDNWQNTLCVQPNQDNEHWRLYVDGVERVLLKDNGAWDHVYLKYPDVDLGVMEAGTHTVTMEAAGLLDTPTNSYTPSVGALATFCVADTQ